MPTASVEVAISPPSSEPVPTTDEVDTTAAAAPGSVLAAEETYSVSVVAVCDGGTTPAVDVNNTGTGAIRVSVGPVSAELTAASPNWHAPWPEIDRESLDPNPKWDAVRLDTLEIFDFGTLQLPGDCPPPPIVPGAPQDISSTPGDGSVSLNWSPPAFDGGSPVTAYVIEYTVAGDDDWIHFGDLAAAATNVVVTGLTNGTTYSFHIIAINANGPGEPGEAKDTPRTVPDAPQSLSALPTNVSGRIHMTWAAPRSTVAPSSPTTSIQRSPNGVDGWTTIADAVGLSTSLDVDGLTPMDALLLPGPRGQRRGNRPAEQCRQRRSRGVPSAPRTSGGDPHEPVRPAPAHLARPGVERWCGDRRLRHPALAERDVGLDDGQRRRQHGDGLHGDRARPTACATTSACLAQHGAGNEPPRATSPTPSRGRFPTAPRSLGCGADQPVRADPPDLGGTARRTAARRSSTTSSSARRTGRRAGPRSATASARRRPTR